MNTTPIPNQVKVDTNQFLDALLQKLNLKNDAALSRLLEAPPPMISKIRHCKLPVGAFLLMHMHEVTDLSIKELRTLMCDHRAKFCIRN